MGLEACCTNNYSKKNNRINSFAPLDEKEIPRMTYKSSNDFLFKEIENKYNLLCHIQLIDYVNLLEDYSPETATLSFNGIMKTDYSYHEEILSYVMTVDTFQSFIENKLFQTQEIYELEGKKNELMMATFKEVFREIFKSLELKLNQHYKEEREDRITKRVLILLGIIFCKSDVVSKIRLIFDLFKNDKNKFVKSEELDKYLLSSFLACSYCMLSARKKITNTNKNITYIKKDDFFKCLKVCELKDSENLVRIFNETFFDKEELSWKEFKSKFENKENGFQWILSSCGIRKMQEENDV